MRNGSASVAFAIVVMDAGRGERISQASALHLGFEIFQH
jgi:hypothetical protein